VCDRNGGEKEGEWRENGVRIEGKQRENGGEMEGRFGELTLSSAASEHRTSLFKSTTNTSSCCLVEKLCRSGWSLFTA